MDSWANFGKDASGREVGYLVKAICDFPGCLREITRSLTCLCGEMHNPAQWGCGLYFCRAHRLQASHKCRKMEILEPLPQEVTIGQEMKLAAKKRKRKVG